MAVQEALRGAWDAFASDPAYTKGALLVLLWGSTAAFVRYNQRFFRALDDRLTVMNLSSRTHHHLDRLLDAFAVVLAALLSLAILGVSGALWGALTALGIAGIIIGFASRDLVANLFAGIVILFEQPFMPGDAIEVAGQGGIVRSVTLRSTTLATWDGRRLTLPNQTFINNSIINYSSNPTRRVDAQVAILNESDVVRAIEVLREVGTAFPQRVPEEAADVRLNEVREYAIVLELRFWVRSEAFVEAKTFAYLEITSRFRREGIELAVPVRRTLTVPGVAAVATHVEEPLATEVEAQ